MSRACPGAFRIAAWIAIGEIAFGAHIGPQHFSTEHVGSALFALEVAAADLRPMSAMHAIANELLRPPGCRDGPNADACAATSALFNGRAPFALTDRIRSRDMW